MTTKAELEPTELSEDIEVLSPGQMLQEARVVAELSQQQVADRLKLRIQVVIDIEADSFDSGLSTTFIKGYLRGYARLVNLSEDLVLSSYQHLNAAQEQRTEMQSFSKRIKQETHDSRLMKFTYLVALGIVALLVIWWLQEKQLDPVFGSLSSESASVVEPAESNHVAIEPSSVDAERTSEIPAPSESQAEESGEPSGADASVTVVKQDTLVSEPSPKLSETNQLAEKEDVVVAAKPSSEAQVPAVPVPPLKTLVMNFENECWVEVRDANGKRLVAAIKKPGDSLKLSGVAPYSIVLGTAAGVNIHYGQDKIDLSSFKRGKVVRMNIPQ
ncbi:cytoskeleton protein RodZ [Agarivorans sp. QJM3NY_25]|uniref:cytoskeleton protein RodZ n=1 Tax=Agarivorans sp. QJM3NY_25 TaxID=3421430 RepID=UPI003D7EAA94